MKKPDIYELNVLPHHSVNQPDQLEVVTPLAYLVPKWKNKGPVNLTNHGVKPKIRTEVIYPKTDRNLCRYQTLVVVPTPGCRQEYPIDSIEYFMTEGSSITIKTTSEGNAIPKAIHFSTARYWMSNRLPD